MNEQRRAGGRAPFHGRSKLDGGRRGVNLALALGLASIGVSWACGRPIRSIPVDTPLELNWPTVLGDASRAGLASQSAPERVERVWRTEVGRGLTAAPIVEGSVVLVTTSNRMVAALNAETGDHYWERQLDGPVEAGAILNGDRLYTVTSGPQGRVYAMSIQRGGRLWSRDVGATSHPPVLVGDALYLATDRGRILALDARNGDELWQARLPAAAASTPTPYRDRLLVAARDSVFLLARLTGEIQERVSPGAGVSTAPALRGDTAYIALHSGEVVAYALPGMNEVWRAPFGREPILAAPVASPDGSLYVLNRAAELWRMPPGGRAPELLTSLSGAAHSSLTVVREGVLVGRLDGALFMLRPDGTEIWREDFDDSIRAPVAVRDGAIYVPLVGGRVVKLGGTS